MPSGEDDRSVTGARAASSRADGPQQHGDAVMPGWYRTAAAASWRFLAIAGAVSVVVYALVHLRVIVIPIIVALLASTLLLPMVTWLKRHRVPDGLAAALAMLAAALALAAVVAAVAPSLGSQLGDLRAQAEDGVRQATDQLAKSPFNLSERELRGRVDEGLQTLRKNSGPLARGLGSGAVLLGEVLTGLIVAVLLCFFPAQGRRGDVGVGAPPRAGEQPRRRGRGGQPRVHRACRLCPRYRHGGIRRRRSDRNRAAHHRRPAGSAAGPHHVLRRIRAAHRCLHH